MESLFARTKSGIKPGLETMQELMDALGHPEKAFLCIHVAGTNGKGSVCAMVASVLQEQGIKTGLFTSPHLIRVNERIRIQGESVSDDLLGKGLDQIEAVEKGLTRLPTFFETLTAVAFLAFREAGVQIAVLETGLGGRLDSTNVVEPLVTGITRIDLDHQEFLGETLPEIAFEKAGILKQGRPAVFGAQQEEALEVLTARAAELGVTVWNSPDLVDVSGRKSSLEGQSVRVSSQNQDYGKIQLPFLGVYQLENVATAISMCEATFEELGVELDSDILKSGIENTNWQGRGQVLSTDPPILLDVAHNPGGAQGLRSILQELFGRKAKGILVWSCLSDKDPEAFLHILKPHISELICVELDLPRAIKGEELLRLAENAGLSARLLSISDAKTVLPDLVAASAFGCVAGSIYLAGEWLSSEVPDPGEALQ